MAESEVLKAIFQNASATQSGHLKAQLAYPPIIQIIIAYLAFEAISLVLLVLNVP
jgi:hypothetical protein